MKLLIFSPYYPPHVGGLESHSDEFNKYLSQKGMDISVFTPQLPENTPDFEIIHKNVKLYRFPAFEIISNYPLPKFWNYRFWKMFFTLFNEEFDIVISRTRFFNTSLLALIYAKIKRVRLIHIEHGSDFVKSGGAISIEIAKMYDCTLGKLVLRNADLVIANSNASAKFCKRIAGSISCEVIYRGVETEKITSASPDLALKNKYSDSVIITFLGRLFNGKGVANLLLALSQVTTKDYICFIIGDGPEKKKLEALAEKVGIKNKIVFFGYKKFNDYIKIIKISDIFVNPSYTEGLPTTITEAALCKNAIIATNVGGTPEIITNEKSGYLIKPKDIVSLKEKLEQLIGNTELRKRFGDSAYEEVQNKFTWEKSIDKYLEIFKTT